ncbi:hypothetical protein DFH07DRAFT_777316 [Mycena maculata]|uniref:Uncharacterized protein n=1 Tax=Mycena maculata TaxID=230809 RepID=A0AAD7II52_9AGAR|nr:hypothetical protein DFH07DRAFT_777316 [Mycena maculata]
MTIAKVESDSRLALRNLPENIACTVRGAFEGFAYDQQRERDGTQKMFSELAAGLAQVRDQLQSSQYKPSKSRHDEVDHNYRSPPLPVSTAMGMSSYSPFGLPQNLALMTPSPFASMPPSPPSMQPSFVSPTAFQNFSINISPTGACITPAILPNLPPTLTPSPFASNNSFNISPHSVPPPPNVRMPIISSGQDPRPAVAKWENLCRNFSASKILAHDWDWIEGDWLPKYTLILAPSPASGVNG